MGGTSRRGGVVTAITGFFHGGITVNGYAVELFQKRPAALATRANRVPSSSKRLRQH